MGAKNMNARKKSAGKNKTDEIFIPDKLYFRIGEVATLCRLPAYVLRFWESEFPQLKPVKSSTGQRMYRRRDVESVLRIKQLLYEQGFTIVGARQQLRSEAKTDKGQSRHSIPRAILRRNAAHPPGPARDPEPTLHAAYGIIAPITPVRNRTLRRKPAVLHRKPVLSSTWLTIR